MRGINTENQNVNQNKMNKNRRRKHEVHQYLKRSMKRATNYILHWVYSGTAFKRLNAEE